MILIFFVLRWVVYIYKNIKIENKNIIVTKSKKIIILL